MSKSRKRGLTLSEVLLLPTTICSSPRSWLHLSHQGHIMITNQRNGHHSTGTVRLTRAEFEKFAGFYERALKFVRSRRELCQKR